MATPQEIRRLAKELKKLLTNNQKVKSIEQTGGVIRVNYDGTTYEVNSAKRRIRERRNRDR